MALLTIGLSAPVDACLRALHERGNELLVVRPGAIADQPFDDSAFGDYAESLVWTEPPQKDELLATVAAFRPDAIAMGNWSRPRSYHAVLRAQPPGVLRLLFLDGQWRGTPRQRLARATRRALIAPVFDSAFVVSDRAELWARRLGFETRDVIRGAYSADVDVFAGPPRSGEELAGARRFLFVGRLAPEKAVDVLAAAYERYRAEASDPWGLDVVGVGALDDRLRSLPGVTMHGFLDPPRLAALMRDSSCLVLPSRFEPWAFVVHEAATSGLPLLVSEAVGAVPALVEDGGNGWIVPAGDVDRWTQALARMSGCDPDRLAGMGRLSQALASRLSPRHWARNLQEEIERRL